MVALLEIDPSPLDTAEEVINELQANVGINVDALKNETNPLPPMEKLYVPDCVTKIFTLL